MIIPSSYIRGFSADAHAVTTMSGAVVEGGTWGREDGLFIKVQSLSSI